MNHQHAQLHEDIQALEDWMSPPVAPKRFTEQELWFFNRTMEMERERDDARRQARYYQLLHKYESRKWSAYKDSLIQRIKSLAGMVRAYEARIAAAEKEQP